LGKPGTEVPRYARRALPHLAHEPAVTPAQLLGDGRVGDVEAGAEDDRVDLALDAVAVEHGALADSLESARDELDVRLLERRVPLVGGQDSLAAQRVVGRQPGTAGTLRNSECSRSPIGRLPCGMIHGAVRWNTKSFSTCCWIAGTYWIADAPVPIDATRLPGQVVVVVPAGGVHGLALKALDARDVRKPRLGQRSHAADQHARGERPRRGADLPPLLVLVPAGRLDLDAREDLEALGAAAQIVADLGLGGVGVRPVGVGQEGERVEVRGNVAPAARIGVGVPAAANVGGALEHEEVVDPPLLEPNCHAQAGEAGAHDDDLPLPVLLLHQSPPGWQDTLREPALT
jgi:hypothetical protein